MPRTLKPSETTTELVALDNNSDASSEDLPNINRALHGSHGSPRQYNSSSGGKSAGSAPVSVGSAPVSAGSAPSGSSEKRLKPSETTIEMVQHQASGSEDSEEPYVAEDDDFQSEMMRVDSVQVMSDSASYAALQDPHPKSGAVGGVLQFTNRIQEEEEKYSESSDEIERVDHQLMSQASQSQFIRVEDSDDENEAMERISEDSEDDTYQMNQELNRDK